MEDLTSRIKKIYKLNRRRAGNKSYTVPSSDTYPYQWFWDSCFHAMVLGRLNEFDRALDELELLVSHKAGTDFIPHILFHTERPKKNEPHFYEWGTTNGSSLVQPPLVAQALLQLVSKGAPADRVLQIFNNYQTHLQYLLERRLDLDLGLMAIINPDESGQDNLPSYDAALELPSNHHISSHLAKRFDLVNTWRDTGFDPQKMRTEFYVIDVLFNVVMIAELEAAVQLLRLLGGDTSDYKASAATMRRNFTKHLITADGAYNLWLDGNDWRHDSVLTWTVLVPLYAGLYPAALADRLVQKYIKNGDELLNEWGIMSTASNEPSFDPSPTKFIGGFWRGPVWHANHWFIFQGLKNSNYLSLAHNTKSCAIKLLNKSGFRECYSPIDGAGLGARNFSWGGLVLDMQ